MFKLDRLFGHRLIMTPIASYIGFGAMVLGAHELAIGAASLWYILPMLLGTFWVLMGVTVGMHRLFCHASFETTKFWNVALAYLGTLAIYGSTVQWAAMHASHHKYADTKNDPHYSGWQYLFWKKNNPTIFNRRVLSRLYRDPIHRFFHKYYAAVVSGTIVGLYLISPHALLFGYLIPLGWLHFVGSAHQVFAHDKTGAKDQEILEYILPTGGEWLHKHHHEHPRDARFGRSDAGSLLISAISR